jgi:hypothetical protein
METVYEMLSTISMRERVYRVLFVRFACIGLRGASCTSVLPCMYYTRLIISVDYMPKGNHVLAIRTATPVRPEFPAITIAAEWTVMYQGTYLATLMHST